MPSSVGPNTFGEENLVFGYDLGDTVNSYKGEPTVNLISNPIVGDYGNAPGSSTNTVSPDGTNNATIPIPNATADRYQETVEGGLYSSGTQFTYSWHYKQLATHTGITPNEPGGLYILGLVNCSLVGSVTKIKDLSNGWSRWKATFQITDGSLQSIFRLYFGYVVGVDGSSAAYYGHQFEQKSYATPFVAGTRSTTQGLKDLTSNSTIDLTNVSFDSNAQMTFDGTNDKIHGVSTPLSYLSSSAFEFVVTPESTGVRMMIGGYRHNEGYSSPTIGAVYIDTDNKFKASVITTAEVYRYAESTTTTSANRTYHVVFNKDTVTGVIQLYINGVGEGAQTFNAATYGQWSSAGSYIGSNNLDFGKSFNTNSGQGWSGDFLDGKIHSIKFYSRTLTASEVKANYNAIKGRFKI